MCFDSYLAGLRRRCAGLLLFLFGFSIALVALGADTPVDLFAKQPVWRIQIEVSPEQLAHLRTESRRYVPATVRLPGGIYRIAGIHLKGSNGSFRSVDEKPGLTIDFSRFVHGQLLHGVQKVHLNNSVEDPSYLKEQIGSELFRAAHVPVPRVGHAFVELNGRELGLYVLKEGFTAEFLARNFERLDGNLYDTDEGHDVDVRMKRHLGSDAADDQLDLQRLAGAASENDLQTRWKRLGETLDIDRFLDFMAVEMMICHWDGYCLGQNNFRVYCDRASSKAFFLPSGMDQVFSKAEMPWKGAMAGFVARALMEIPQGQQRYAIRVKSLFERLFNSQQLTNSVNQHLAELRPFVAAAEFESICESAAELCAQISKREAYLRAQLTEPAPPLLRFTDGRSSLAGWRGLDEPAGGKVQETESPDGKPALSISAGPKTSASWRTTVRLPRGVYEFGARARTLGVRPLSFGNTHGATIRVFGQRHRSAELSGTTEWKELVSQFEVKAEEEEIVLVCELRAAAGTAWFEKNSLWIRSIPW